MQPHWQQTREQALSSPVVRQRTANDNQTSICRTDARSAAWGQIGNERGRGFFVQTCWPCALRPEKCWGAWLRNRLCAFPLPRENNAINGVSETSAKPMSGCARCAAIGMPESASMWVHVGDLGRRYVPVLPDLSLDADAFSGASGKVTARAGKRSRDQLFADAGTNLAEPGEPSVRGSRPTRAPGTFDPVAACLWAVDAFATTP